MKGPTAKHGIAYVIVMVRHVENIRKNKQEENKMME